MITDEQLDEIQIRWTVLGFDSESSILRDIQTLVAEIRRLRYEKDELATFLNDARMVIR